MARLLLAFALFAAVLPGMAMAQDSDLAPVPSTEAGYGTAVTAPASTAAPAAAAQATPAAATPPPPETTYARGDILGAAENTFGKGAEGLAKIIEKIFKDNGEPNGYIAGREAGGAIAIGLRYGSGTLSHKVEGQRPVYWTGPSLGFDLGANASKVFVLVYNLYDSQELYHRYPAVEGQVYFVGGFTFAYLRRKDVMLVPVRLGVGWRLGANIGYMKFSETSKWMPF